MGAELKCQSLGRNGHLVSINSEAEADLVTSYIERHQKKCVNVWIGLHDPRRNGRWTWINGSPQWFSAWAPGMPDNYLGNEYCTELRCQEGYVTWNDVHCDNVRPYLCKY
ncbi:UNVERIFIED_CONTAM: hypothetical protein K2H54_077886 [Gekko kuhli]